ncbi:MAG TPA: GerMN domain-containing protein [Syntrophorhabdaceae bacterium]|nr:GerMN domain-containing protein [Syntrophorhabdaceae bacterium]
MRKKKRPNLYLRQYREFENKPPRVRKSFLAALVLVLFLIGLATAYLYKDLWMKKPQQIITFMQKDTLLVYAPKDEDRLVERKFDIRNNMADKDKGDLIMKNLKNLKVIPEGAMLKDFTADSDGIIYVNFSRAFLEAKPSAISEILRTFSIVNSFLGNFRNAKGVMLLIDGQPVYTPSGAIYAYKPLEFNQDLLED